MLELIYKSVAPNITEAEIDHIIQTSVRMNEKNDVTGLLVFDSKKMEFLQSLHFIH